MDAYNIARHIDINDESYFIRKELRRYIITFNKLTDYEISEIVKRLESIDDEYYLLVSHLQYLIVCRRMPDINIVGTSEHIEEMKGYCDTYHSMTMEEKTMNLDRMRDIAGNNKGDSAAIALLCQYLKLFLPEQRINIINQNMIELEKEFDTGDSVMKICLMKYVDRIGMDLYTDNDACYDNYYKLRRKMIDCVEGLTK